MSHFGTFSIIGVFSSVILMGFSVRAEDLRTPASINRAAIALSAPSKIFYGENGEEISPQLITAYNQIKSEQKPIDLSPIMPTNVAEGTPTSKVISQIMDRGASYIWNSEAVQSSQVGRMGRETEEKLRQEVVMDADSKTPQKIRFNMAAFQSLAQIQYEGYTHAAVNYKLNESTLGFEVSEKVIGNKDLVVSHELKPSDRLSQVSLKWSF